MAQVEDIVDQQVVGEKACYRRKHYRQTQKHVYLGR